LKLALRLPISGAIPRERDCLDYGRRSDGRSLLGLFNPR
jgi:hypothetical protein